VRPSSSVAPTTPEAGGSTADSRAGNFPYLNVLQVAASVAPRDGGPTTATLSINREFLDLGTHSLILATTADGKDATLDRVTTTPHNEQGAKVLFCDASRPRSLKNSWSQGLRVFLLTPRHHILHVHGVYLAHTIWAFLAARLWRRPYVVQPHGTLEPYQQTFSQVRKRIFDRLIGRRILARADLLIAASSSEARNLRAQLPHSRVAVVPLGVTLLTPALSSQEEEALGAWLGLPRQQRVLYLGRLARKKRPDLLVQSWNSVRFPGHLVIAGPAQDWDSELLGAMTASDRRASITYMDQLTPTSVAGVMDAAGIFVLPSENENFAITVAEAMAYRCAVVTTPETAAGEHVEAAGGGVVIHQLDRAKLTAAIDEMLSNPHRVDTMGEAAAAYAAQNLTWRATAARLQHCYTAVAEREWTRIDAPPVT
jgi:glycosyltransferase involved in cell wall biosynthesis